MNYQAVYDNLIRTRKDRVLVADMYYEKHHILPKSLGGSDFPENLVKLTAREHYLAHLLLWKIHGTDEMFYAFFMMSKRFGISSRDYESMKMKFSKMIKTRLSGRKFSSTHKENLLKGISERNSKISKTCWSKIDSEMRIELMRKVSSYRDFSEIGKKRTLSAKNRALAKFNLDYPILQVDKTGEERLWKNMTEIADFYPTGLSQIFACVNGTVQNAHCSTWVRYIA